MTESALRRFEASMVMDYEKWHDGIGYDLDAIAQATSDERAAIERLLLARNAADWRDVEALAALGTPRAEKALLDALSSPNAEVRLAVTRHAPHLVPDAKRTKSLVKAIRKAELGEGLTQAIDEAAEYHPPEVVDALFEGALKREAVAAVHFAALLFYVHGKAAEPFDDAKRPFFLKVSSPGDHPNRPGAFRELCAELGVDPARYLKS